MNKLPLKKAVCIDPKGSLTKGMIYDIADMGNKTAKGEALVFVYLNGNLVGNEWFLSRFKYISDNYVNLESDEYPL